MGGGGGGAPREGADDVLGFEPIIDNKISFHLYSMLSVFFFLTMNMKTRIRQQEQSLLVIYY